jgi:hypothetical protein
MTTYLAHVHRGLVNIFGSFNNADEKKNITSALAKLSEREAMNVYLMKSSLAFLINK